MESLFKLFETISPSGYQYKDKKSYHPFWMQEGGSGVTSYNDLTDLPKIGGIEVKGNKSLGTYHLYSKDEVDSKLDDKQNKLTAGSNITINEEGVISAQTGGSGGTTNYGDLTNKPQINGITLSGNKTSADLSMYTKNEVDDLLTGYITSAQLVERLAAKADLIQSVTYDGNQLKYFDPVTQRYQNVPISGGEGSIHQVETKVGIDNSWGDTALQAFINTLLNSAGVLAIQLSCGTLTKYGDANLLGYVHGDTAHNIVYLTGTTNKGYPCSLELWLSSLANFKSHLKLNIITDEVSIANNKFKMYHRGTHFLDLSGNTNDGVRFNSTTNKLEFYNSISGWLTVPILTAYEFDITDTMITDAGLPSPWVLNSEGFIFSVGLTKGSTHFAVHAGSDGNVVAHNAYIAYCYKFNESGQSHNRLVVLAKHDITDWTVSSFSVIRYPHMSSQGTLTSALAFPFDTTKEGHLVDITVNLQRRYPTGTPESAGTTTLRYLFITTPSNNVVPIVIDTHYNLKLGNTSYNSGTYTITSLPSDNSYDVSQDSVTEAVSATARVVEEW